MKTLFPKRKFENLFNLFLRLFDFQISCLLSTVFNVDHFIMYITPRYFRLRVGWVGIYLRFLAFISAPALPKTQNQKPSPGLGFGCGRRPTHLKSVVDEMVNLTSAPIAHTIKRIEKKVRSISIASFLSVVNCCFVPTTFGVICIYILYIYTHTFIYIYLAFV